MTLCCYHSLIGNPFRLVDRDNGFETSLRDPWALSDLYDVLLEMG